MIRLVITIILILNLSVCLNAQYYPKSSPAPILERINHVNTIFLRNLVDSIGSDSMNNLVRELKEFTDDLYYTTKWQLSLQETDWDKRVFLLREISLYPYYLVKNIELQNNARILYEGSVMKLIKEYSGNVELLNSIYIHESYRRLVYPVLKDAIESAGGTWDRGSLSPNTSNNIRTN